MATGVRQCVETQAQVEVGSSCGPFLLIRSHFL